MPIAGPSLSPGAAFGLYAWPSDDLAGTAADVFVGSGGSPSLSTGSPPFPYSSGSPSDEDPEYPATNLIAPSLTGHLNRPSRPAKLLSFSGAWHLFFTSPITVSSFHLVYH